MARLFDGEQGDVVAARKYTTAVTSHNATRTYACWALARGFAGGAGRYFDKRTAGGEIELLRYASTGGGRIEFVRSWTTSGGTWGWAPPSHNVWHHMALTYDSGLVGNDPLYYINGVSQTLVSDIAPVGAPALTHADPYVVGNRGTGTPDKEWDGRLAYFGIWNTILTQPEIESIYEGDEDTPLGVQTGSLVCYYKMKTPGNSEVDSAGVSGVATNTVANLVGGPFDASGVLLPRFQRRRRS